MGRPSKDKKIITANVLVSVWQVLAEHAKSLGYTMIRAGKERVLWGEYFGAIAGQITQGKIKIPPRVANNN